MARFSGFPMHDFFFCLAWTAGISLLFPLQISAEDVVDSKLKRLGIEPTPAGVKSFLTTLVADENREQRVRNLIAQLGSPRFEEREAAMAGLTNLPVPPLEQLKEATHADDLEIRVRARRLLAKAQRQGYEMKLVAVLQYIAHHEVKGLAGLLIRLLPQVEKTYIFRHAERALRATVGPADADLLREWIARQPSPRREAALLALGAALGNRALPELLPNLRNAESSMRLAAAEALADLGRRECLPVLVDLLESPQVEERQRSATILRALTGERFSFPPAGDAKPRALAARSWKKWLGERGETARLTFPFPRHQIELGRTLVCVWSEKTFKEVTADKEDIFSIPAFKYVWGCHATPDGRRLVVDAERKIVLEFDEAGNETWRRIDLPGRPTGVEGLENGGVLVACSDSNQVVEITRGGRVVWDLTIEGRPTTAQRLPNGHTVINLQNAGQVVEVDNQGNIQVLVSGLDRAHTAQMLDNGNVLVTEMRLNRVDEYNPGGNIVWSKADLKNPAQAQRLSNGNTLIADEEGLQEFDPNNNRVWHLEVTRSRFFRY